MNPYRGRRFKSGQRREIPLNDGAYGSLVGLGPKDAGRAFGTRSIRTAFDNAVAAARLEDVTFRTRGTRSPRGP